MPDVDRAARAFGADHPVVRIEQGDMTTADFGQADVITILDALHCFDHAHQIDVLQRIRAALPPAACSSPGRRCLGPALYHLCNWVDHAVTFMRGHRLPRLCRTAGRVGDAVAALRLRRRNRPDERRQAFANVMLVCRVPSLIPAAIRRTCCAADRRIARRLFDLRGRRATGCRRTWRGTDGKTATAWPTSLGEADVRKRIARLLPASVKDKAGWAEDLHTAFKTLEVPHASQTYCARCHHRAGIELPGRPGGARPARYRAPQELEHAPGVSPSCCSPPR